MRHFFLLIVGIFILGSLKAQEVFISESINLRNDNSYYILGKYQNQQLMLRDRPAKATVNAFDEEMNSTWEKELEFEKRNHRVMEVVPQQDHFSIIYRIREKGDQLIKIRKYNGSANMIDSITIANYGSSFLSETFNVLLSEDRTKLMIHNIEGFRTIQAIVFDITTMSNLYSHSFQKLDTGYDEYYELILDNEGNSYLVTQLDNRRSRRKSHRYEVEIKMADSKGFTKDMAMMRGRLTYHVKFSFDNLNKSLVAGGVYMEKQRLRSEGSFYVKIPIYNRDGKMVVFKPFPDALIESVEGKYKRKKKGISEVIISDVVPRRDGGALIVGEKVKDFQTYASNGRGYYSNFRSGFNPIVSDLYYEDLFVIAVHPNGELHYNTFFYKKQYSKNDGGVFSSYFVMKTPEMLRFLFNDEIVQNSTVSAYQLTPNGNSERKSIFSTNFQDLKLRIRDSRQVSDTEIIIPSELLNEVKLVKVSY